MTINNRRLRALVIKECLQIVRDPSTFLIAVCLPLILMFLYGYGVSLDLDRLKIGLVMEDTSPLAQSFAQSLKNSRYFDVKIERDRHELYHDMIKGSIRGIVVIPSYFTQYRLRPGKIAPIQVIADGSETNTSNFVQNYVRGAFNNWVSQQAESSGYLKGTPLITSEPIYWFNKQLESRHFLLSGSLAIIMTLIGSLLTALVVAREWERGTMEALISTSVQKSELVFGKVIPYFFLGMVSMTICVLVSTLVYQLPLRGSWIILGVVSALFLYCALSLGLMISTIAKNQVLAYQITIIVAFLPAYIMSGFLFEIYSMPKWIELLTYIVPARYFVQSLQTLFLVGNVWKLLLNDMIPIVIIGTILFIITYIKTVKRLD